MAITGTKPKPEGQIRHRVQPVHDWIYVVNVPYSGERPKPGRLPKYTRDWWEDVTTQPHCALWTKAQWRFAVDTAKVHARAFAPKSGVSLIAELRVREKQIGVTADQLRDLRIRYVDPEESGQGEEEEIGVTKLNDYRAGLLD